jgi:hypothetical protein
MGSLLSGMLNQTIDKISSITRDAYGDITKSTVWENVPCRFEISTLRTQGTTTEVLSYRARAWLYSDYSDIAKEYIVTKDSEDYKIAAIEKHYNLEGELDHIVLVLE